MPPGDRDEFDAPKPGELPSEFIKRIRPEVLEFKPKAKGGCGCAERGWTEQHGEDPITRIDRIMDGEADGREPGSEG